MNSKILIAGAAAVALIAGTASAQMTPDASTPASGSSTTGTTPGMTKGTMTHHHHMHMHHHHHMTRDRGETSEYAAPANPIPYADLSKYKEDDRQQRMAMEGVSGGGMNSSMPMKHMHHHHMHTKGMSNGMGPDRAKSDSTTPSSGAPTGTPGDTSAVVNGQGPGTAPSDYNVPASGPMDTTPPVNGGMGAQNQMPTEGMGHVGAATVGTPAAGTPDTGQNPHA
jgi:hypothetical protein